MKAAFDKCSKMIMTMTDNTAEVTMRYHWLLVRQFKQLPVVQRIQLTESYIAVSNDLRIKLDLLGIKYREIIHPLRFRVCLGTVQMPFLVCYVNERVRVGSLRTKICL